MSSQGRLPGHRQLHHGFYVDTELVVISGQSLLVLLFSLLLIGALYLFFDRTLYGKALRATALNRVGARLVDDLPEPAAWAGIIAGVIGILLGWLVLAPYRARRG